MYIATPTPSPAKQLLFFPPPKQGNGYTRFVQLVL